MAARPTRPSRSSAKASLASHHKRRRKPKRKGTSKLKILTR